MRGCGVAIVVLGLLAPGAAAEAIEGSFQALGAVNVQGNARGTVQSSGVLFESWLTEAVPLRLDVDGVVHRFERTTTSAGTGPSSPYETAAGIPPSASVGTWPKYSGSPSGVYEMYAPVKEAGYMLVQAYNCPLAVAIGECVVEGSWGDALETCVDDRLLNAPADWSDYTGNKPRISKHSDPVPPDIARLSRGDPIYVHDWPSILNHRQVSV